MSCVLPLEYPAKAEFDLPEIDWPKLVQGADVYAHRAAPAAQSQLLKSATPKPLDTLQI